MPNEAKQDNLIFGRFKTSLELGQKIRAFRKYQQLTLEQVSGISRLGIRFLSELERGKKTAELGKALEAIDKLGLEIIIQARGTDQKQRQERLKQQLTTKNTDEAV